MCAYSHDAQLYNYSFLVKLHVPSSLLLCTWNKYTVITPSGMTVQNVLPACTRYQRSGYGQRSWWTTTRHFSRTLRTNTNMTSAENRQQTSGACRYPKGMRVSISGSQPCSNSHTPTRSGQSSGLIGKCRKWFDKFILAAKNLGCVQCSPQHPSSWKTSLGNNSQHHSLSQAWDTRNSESHDHLLARYHPSSGQHPLDACMNTSPCSP